MALAIRKDDPGWPALDAAIKQAAAAGWPNVCNAPTFAWKITDGDSAIPNKKGKLPRDRDGYAGCWVLHFSSGTVSRCYQRNDQGALVECDPALVKTGYYARIAGNACGNDSATNPGIYLNHNMVEMVAFGPEIVSGPDANDAFGAPAALPPGASMTPVALAPAAAPAAPAPVAAPVAPVTTPHTAFLAGPPPAAPAADRYIHPGGGVFTRDQLVAAKWTDAQIAALPRA
jgi:hypothetical protein